MTAELEQRVKELESKVMELERQLQDLKRRTAPDQICRIVSDDFRRQMRAHGH